MTTWLGTCSECPLGLRPDASGGSCVRPSSLRLNTLVELEAGEGEAANSGADGAKKAEKRPFPTVVVAGLGIVVVVLAAVAGLLWCRSSSKTTHENIEQEMPARAENGDQPAAQDGEAVSPGFGSSIEAFNSENGLRRATKLSNVEEAAGEHGAVDSGSPKSSTDSSK